MFTETFLQAIVEFQDQIRMKGARLSHCQRVIAAVRRSIAARSLTVLPTKRCTSEPVLDEISAQS